MKSISAVLSLAVLAGWTWGAKADDQPLDKDFLIKTASCEHAAIEFAKMAEKKATSPKVKDFAARLAKDHQKCYDKLSEVSKNQKVAIVAGLEKDTKAEMERLDKLSGAEFDREFISGAIKGHKEFIARFEAQALNGKEEELRNFAKGTLPGLRAYLKEAEDLAKELAS